MRPIFGGRVLVAARRHESDLAGVETVPEARSSLSTGCLVTNFSTGVRLDPPKSGPGRLPAPPRRIGSTGDQGRGLAACFSDRARMGSRDSKAWASGPPTSQPPRPCPNCNRALEDGIERLCVNKDAAKLWTCDPLTTDEALPHTDRGSTHPAFGLASTNRRWQPTESSKSPGATRSVTGLLSAGTASKTTGGIPLWCQRRIA